MGGGGVQVSWWEIGMLHTSHATHPDTHPLSRFDAHPRLRLPGETNGCYNFEVIIT